MLMPLYIAALIIRLRFALEILVIRLISVGRPVLKRRGFPYRSTDNPLQV